jgi:hypothetical protein
MFKKISVEKKVVWIGIIFVLVFGIITWHGAVIMDNKVNSIADPDASPLLAEFDILIMRHYYALAFEKIVLVGSFVFMSIAFWLKLRNKDN